MKRNYLLLTALAVSIAGTAFADDRRDRDHRLFAILRSVNEVPAVVSPASGSFVATWDDATQTLTYELTYKDLEAAPLQAHIHVGQKDVNGGISVFLCGNGTNVPAATVPQPPACPAAPATITGTLTAANIVGPAAQGVAPTTPTTDEASKLIQAIRNGVTYANVHSAKYPGGEIRGQVQVTSLHNRR